MCLILYFLNYADTGNSPQLATCNLAYLLHFCNNLLLESLYLNLVFFLFALYSVVCFCSIDGGTTYSCLSKKGDIIVISRIGVIKAWLVSNGQSIFEIRGHNELAPISICVYGEEEALAVFRLGSLQILELENGEILKQYSTKIKKHASDTSKTFLSSLEGLCVIFHKDEITDAKEHSLLVETFHISSHDRHEVFRLKTENDILSLDVVMSNQLLVTYGVDLDKNRKSAPKPSVSSTWQKMSLELWDIKSMKPTSQLTTVDDSVRCSCVSPRRNEVIMLCNMSFIETASEYLCFVKVYSLTDGKSFKLPLNFPSGILSLCGLGFSCLISASADKIIRVWDLERTLDMESQKGSRKETVIGAGGKLSEEPDKEANDVVNGYEGRVLSKQSLGLSPTSVALQADASAGSEVKSISTVDNSDMSQDFSQISERDKTSSSTSNVDIRPKLSRNGWKKMKSFPVGKNFLKLRYSTLSTALQRCDIDSGESLEDLSVVSCHKDMIVFLARRMVDSVCAVVAWKLSTDVKMRISELHNPDACVLRAGRSDYLVILSSNVISVYDFTTGAFIRCKDVNIDVDGTERLSSLKPLRVLVTEAGRRSLKVMDVPSLDVLKSIAFEDNTVIVR